MDNIPRCCRIYNHHEKEHTCASGAVKKYLSHISGSLPDNQKIFPVFPTEKIDLFYILNIIRCLLIYKIVQPIGKH